MRIIVIFAFSLIGFVGFSQNQAEMNNEAIKSLNKVDAELNQIYNKIISKYKKDTVFIKNLKSSQRIWITFRDAELKMKYPEREPGYYGSIFPVCRAEYLKELIQQRIKTLKIRLDDIEEGDACSGSIMTKY